MKRDSDSHIAFEGRAAQSSLEATGCPRNAVDAEAMTAVTGANLRGGEAYWELSGPTPITRTVTCRACKKTIMRGESVMVRDGRKLRFHYHTECFSGDADPRTQQNSSFSTRNDYHAKTAPKLSSLEGPRACTDADGRKLGREVFKDKAPASVGVGKWNSGPLGVSRGYHPPAATLLTVKDLPCEKGRRRTYDNNK